MACVGFTLTTKDLQGKPVRVTVYDHKAAETF